MKRDEEGGQFTTGTGDLTSKGRKGRWFRQGTRHEPVIRHHINQPVTVKSMVLIVTQ